MVLETMGAGGRAEGAGDCTVSAGDGAGGDDGSAGRAGAAGSLWIRESLLVMYAGLTRSMLTVIRRPAMSMVIVFWVLLNTL